MSHRETVITSSRAWPWWRFGLAALASVGLALSAYLSWHYLAGGSVIGCNGGGGCDQVLRSRWSTIGGVIPVSGLAAGAYLAMLLTTFFIGSATAAPERRLAWGAMLVLAGATAGSAVWFTIVQRWIVGALCPYCMATHITGVLLALLILWQSPRQLAAAVAAPRIPAPAATAEPGANPAARLTGRLYTVGLCTVGVALAAILVLGQLAFTVPAVYRGGATQQNSLPALDPHAVPLMGAPDAPMIVTMLFDYKCPHCQKMHAMLDDVIRREGGKVAFALCPAPLNTKCNPYISRQVDEFKDSCELARIGLAVWVAKRDAFPEFDNWMFAPPEADQLWHGRTPDAATAKAVALVGQAKFDAALADPWIDRYMQTSIRIFGGTILPDQSGNAVPKLVLGARWVTPEPDSPDDLVTILHDALGVARP